MVLLERTDFQGQLVALYSAADVFFNPTFVGNFPTFNLKDETCDTPVITYATGGCRETLRSSRLEAVEGFEAACRIVKDWERVLECAR